MKERDQGSIYSLAWDWMCSQERREILDRFLGLQDFPDSKIESPQKSEGVSVARRSTAVNPSGPTKFFVEEEEEEEEKENVHTPKQSFIHRSH